MYPLNRINYIHAYPQVLYQQAIPTYTQPLQYTCQPVYYPTNIQPKYVNWQMQTTPYPQNSHEIYLKNFCSDLTDEEKNLIYSNTFNDKLYENKRFAQLAKHGIKGYNYLETYNFVKYNKDFNELINSKYFKGADGFLNILTTINSLQKQRTENLKQINPIPTGGYINPAIYIDYAKYDIPDYLKMINDFIKSNISDDLKKYYINCKISDINVYYASLNNIANSSDIVKDLI